MTTFEGFLTVTQAARRLCVHRCTISRHIAAGDLAAFRSTSNGRVRLVDLSDVEAIEKATRDKGRTRNDWNGKDWMDILLEAHAGRTPDGRAELLLGSNDIWPEIPLPPLESTEQTAQPWDDDEDDDD